jgi:tRNA A37 threonylcarbamoyladenosine biosynthesis protein TsaE
VFLYGPSGCGKTTFTLDCLRYLTHSDNTEIGSRILTPIYVDCVEFYSEKLIATYISIFLNNMLKQLFREAAGPSK